MTAPPRFRAFKAPKLSLINKSISFFGIQCYRLSMQRRSVMRVIGSWTLSSFVKILMDISCFLTATFLVLASFFLIFVVFYGVDTGTMDVPVSVQLDPQTYEVASPSLGIENAQIELHDIQAHLRFPTQRGVFLFSTLVMIIIMLALILWVLTQLRHIFRTLRNGQPFLSANAGRIRRIGFAVILG